MRAQEYLIFLFLSGCFLFRGHCAFYFFLRGLGVPITASVFLLVVYVTEPLSLFVLTLMNFLFLLSGMALFAIAYLDGRFSSIHLPKPRNFLLEFLFLTCCLAAYDGVCWGDSQLLLSSQHFGEIHVLCIHGRELSSWLRDDCRPDFESRLSPLTICWRDSCTESPYADSTAHLCYVQGNPNVVTGHASSPSLSRVKAAAPAIFMRLM